MQWVELELGVHSSSWGAVDRQSSAPQSGGVAGNVTYTQDKNELSVDGRVPVSDVWGKEAVLNVPPPCTVSFETTTDNRYQPPETVVKAVVTNPSVQSAQGSAQSVVFFHDGVKIRCNASLRSDGTSRATDSTGGVILGEYRADSETGSAREASIAGEFDPNTDSTRYDGTGREEIKFWPQGSGRAGDVATHDVEGNADIYVKNTDEVYVRKTAEGEYEVVVKHADGSSDKFLIHREYRCNLNGMPEHIFFGADANGSGGSNPVAEEGSDWVELPPEFAEDFGLNGVAGSAPRQVPAALADLANFVHGKHNAATMTQLFANLKEVFGADNERALLTVPANDRPGFEEWMASNWNTLFDPAQPNPKVLDFLFNADPTLAALFAQVKGQDIGSVADVLQDIQTRLVADLQQLGFATASAVDGRYPYTPEPLYVPVYGVKLGDKSFGFYELGWGITQVGEKPIAGELSGVEWN